MTEARAGAARIAELLNARPGVVDRPTAVAVSPATGALAVHRVGFGYPGSGRIALREVSFTARPGELILVTGPSGAGKSTLAGRAAITWLPQDSTVVTGTPADNISYGSPGGTPDQVMAAARAAGAQGSSAGCPRTT
jgi:ATP-binding cassette subfamily B protein